MHWLPMKGELQVSFNGGLHSLVPLSLFLWKNYGIPGQSKEAEYLATKSLIFGGF